jgi:hypothetical protein
MLNFRFKAPRLRSPRATRVTDRRSGRPVRRGPDPMPRIRWYS